MKLIDFKSLGPAKSINYSRDHLRRKCKAGEFPKPILLSGHRIAWIEAEVDEWLADMARARRCDPWPGEALPRIVGDPDPPGCLLQA
jgi:predicted DNA-binding transcriptional regulator AlpA